MAIESSRGRATLRAGSALVAAVAGSLAVVVVARRRATSREAPALDDPNPNALRPPAPEPAVPPVVLSPTPAESPAVLPPVPAESPVVLPSTPAVPPVVLPPTPTEIPVVLKPIGAELPPVPAEIPAPEPRREAPPPPYRPALGPLPPPADPGDRRRWWLEDGRLRIDHLGPLPKPTRAALESEAHALLHFATDAAPPGDVVLRDLAASSG